MNSKFKHLSTLIVIVIIALIFLSVAYAGVTDVVNGSGVTVKTTVRKNYTDSIVNGIIDLTDGKNYTVDFTKTDNFSKGLQLLADLNKTKLYNVAYVFILAGAFGNAIDRTFLGYVRDFIKLDFINFPVFNVADSLLVVGVILLAFYIIFHKE